MSKITKKVDLVGNYGEDSYRLATISIALECPISEKEFIDSMAEDFSKANKDLILFMGKEMSEAFSEEDRNHITLVVSDDIEYGDENESFDDIIERNKIDQEWLKNGREIKGGQL